MAAFNASTYWEVEFGGSDSLNGGGFDPGNLTRDATLTASSANTASPVVTCSSYTFVTADVGAWLFVRTGTNWIPGWYKIASISGSGNGNTATLSAAIGAGVKYVNGDANLMSTLAGCATTASPTAGTWSIDYSQQNSAAFSLTGMTTSGATAVLLTASATLSMVGNFIQITGGTLFLTGIYAIQSVSAGTSLTLNATCTSGIGAAGAGGVGGALKTLGGAGLVAVSSNRIWQQYNASPYLVTSSTANVAAGLISGLFRGAIIGYNTNRFLGNSDANRPTNKASGIASVNMLTPSGPIVLRNIILDGNSLTGMQGFRGAGASTILFRCDALNFKNSGFFNCGTLYECFANNCVTAAAFLTCTLAKWCAAIGSTSVPGFSGVNCDSCVASGGGTGFTAATSNQYINCTSFGNSSEGFKFQTDNVSAVNCISYGNTGVGFNANASTIPTVETCAAGSNSTNFDSALYVINNEITLTANPFANSGATITVLTDVWAAFALNSTAGGGASCRAAGLLAYEDLGAVQHQDSGGSKATVEIMTGGAM